MMKQYISLILAACLCISLAGCYEKQASVKPEITVSGSAPVTAPSEAREVPVTESAPMATEPPETQQTQPPEIEQTQPAEPADSDFVLAASYLPNLQIDLKYASEDNFTGQRIYGFEDVYLRFGTMKKLISVQEELESMGLGLKIWDGFRPVSAQFALWEVCPDPTYVANPETGYSSHSRGNTVDLTLVDAAGEELEMPTGFDDFTALADRDYSDCTAAAAENALLLQEIMEKHGFKGYFGEWWHFSDQDSYSVEEEFQPAFRSRYYAACNEFISLREAPDVAADVITRIPVNEEFILLGYHGDFAMVEYRGLQGYVLADYMQPVQESAE